MARKLTLFDKALIVSGLSAVLLFAGYVWFMNRQPRHYYIPEGFSGWVTIRYEKPDAPALEEKDGVLMIWVPENGIVETSSKLVNGWARDEHFWYGDGQVVSIPKAVGEGNDRKRYIHDDTEVEQALDSIIMQLPSPCDTTLWDGTRISKLGEKADVRSGRKILQHFYVSGKPELFWYEHDSLPPARNFW